MNKKSLNLVIPMFEMVLIKKALDHFLNEWSFWNSEISQMYQKLFFKYLRVYGKVEFIIDNEIDSFHLTDLDKETLIDFINQSIYLNQDDPNPIPGLSREDEINLKSIIEKLNS